MNTQPSSKLAALGIALMMNGLMIGGVAYLFNGHQHQRPVVALVQVTATASQSVI